MTRKPTSARSRKISSIDPAADPVGAFLVKQRPEVLPGGHETVQAAHAMERITDAGAIGALLSSVSNYSDTAEDDLIFELLYLETLIAAQPLRSSELLDQLGALGDEVREGLLPPGMIDIVALRRRTRRLRQNLGVMASRVSAALLMLFTSIPAFAQSASAEEEAALNSFQIAAAPVVRVIDANSGNGLAGVQIKSMEEKLLGVTDATGQATLAEDYRDTDLLSLEKDGYELSLLERSQLSSRNIVSMKPLADDAKMAAAATPTRPQAPVVRAPVPPKDPSPPRIAVHNDGHPPTITPPKTPTAPRAPQIRLPVKPRPAVVAVAPKPTATPAAHAPAAHAPVKPSAPVQHAAATPKPHAAPVLATPKAPVQHAAAPQHTTPDPLASAARRTAISMPARPRQPVHAPAAHAATPHRAAPMVAIPKRVPAARHTTAHANTGSAYYQVKQGDSLAKIAKRQLGSATRWPEIYAANRDRVANPTLIRPGQTLLVPRTSLASHGRRAYVVKPGDSLFRIAGAQMGNPLAWQNIYSANRDKIRNANYIFPGQTIYLPT